MHWKIKAAIQNAIALLPESLSYASYHWMQRQFGGLKTTNPMQQLIAGIEMWRLITDQGIDPTHRVFFEVGTGTSLGLPIAFWLQGARRTVTVDLNPYLSEDVVRQDLQYIEANQHDVIAVFGASLQQKQMDRLLEFARRSDFSLEGILDLCCIEYVAPGDAARTGLSDGSIDFHTSFTVLEHIPPTVLAGILKEGNRIVRENGLFVHRIDYTDHFSHSDPRISRVNFLQYSDAQWTRYAGNRFMYMNRLRHDDMLALFHAAGHRILSAAAPVHAPSLEILNSGRLPVNERFQAKSQEMLAIWGSWIVSQLAAPRRVTPGVLDEDVSAPALP